MCDMIDSGIGPHLCLEEPVAPVGEPTKLFGGSGRMPEVDEFYAGQEESRQIFEAVRLAVVALGQVEMRVSKSQISFRRRRAFAFVWMPGQYLHRKAAPLVLTLSFRSRDSSPRWKEIVEPAPGRFTHHLELYSPSEVDEQVRDWLHSAWLLAA